MKSSAYEQRKAALIEEITAAFDGVSRENGVSLSESWIIDDYGSDEEQAEARKQDTETRWQDVPDEGICYGYSCLSFLDDIGFHYYIPAYVVWFLRNIDNDDPEAPSEDSNTFESLIYALGPIGSGDLEEYDLSRFRVFTPEQSKAIAHFLEFEEEREEAGGVKYEKMRQEMLSEEGFSQEEIDESGREEGKLRLEHAENDARRALEKYWGQFK